MGTGNPRQATIMKTVAGGPCVSEDRTKSSCSFHGIVEIRGVNPYVLVKAGRARVLRPGCRGPIPVLLRLDGQPSHGYRINLMPVGDGSFYLYLNGIVRKAAAVKVGDRVRVELRFDAGYRNGPQHPMPAWFREALEENPTARQHWDSLIPSRRKEVLRYFANLKSREARARNLERALRVLSGASDRFMGRTWNENQDSKA
jgi:bacteriocin resistance YdeI/OmpD-like protein/uncharacterized protein DUF1905